MRHGRIIHEIYCRRSITLLLPRGLALYATAIGRRLNNRYRGIFHPPRIRSRVKEPVILIGSMREESRLKTPEELAIYHEDFRSKIRAAITYEREELEREFAKIPVNKYSSKKELLEFAELNEIDSDDWDKIKAEILRRL